jgi:hypothetical protein
LVEGKANEIKLCWWIYRLKIYRYVCNALSKLQVVHNVKMGVVGNWEKKGQKLSAVQRGRRGNNGE